MLSGSNSGYSSEGPLARLEQTERLQSNSGGLLKALKREQLGFRKMPLAIVK